MDGAVDASEVADGIAIEIEVYIDKFTNKNKMLSINQIKIIQKKIKKLTCEFHSGIVIWKPGEPGDDRVPVL